jgi:putative tricarboxylic transport membrane protein
MGLALVAPFMVMVALSFGTAEYFALMVLSFLTVSAAFGGSITRGLTALFIGLTIGIVGTDKLTGQVRLAFGIPEMSDNISIAIVAVGCSPSARRCTSPRNTSTTRTKAQAVRARSG